MASRIDDTVYHAGEEKFADIILPSSCVGADQVEASAGIEASKLQHQRKITYGTSGTAASATVPIFEAEGACTIKKITAGSIAIAVGAATVTVDLKKNGSTILSAVITLDSGNVARVSEAGTLSATSLVDGNLLELVIVATAGGGTIPTGLWVQVTIDEAYTA